MSLRTQRTLHLPGLLAGLALLLAPTCTGEGNAAAGDAQPTPRAITPASALDAEALEGRVRILLSGQLEGRLEPCGCASGQLGGLARRSFRLQQVRGSYDLLLEGGNLVGKPDGFEPTPLDEEKLLTALTVLADEKTPYDAVGLGPQDLVLGTDLVGQFFSGFPLPLVASDLAQETVPEGQLPFPARAFVETSTRSGETVRVASLTLPATPPAGLEVLAPAAAWDRALDGAAPGTFRILMVHSAPRARLEELAKTMSPRPDLVVGVGPAPQEPTREPAYVESAVDGREVPLVFTGTRGRYLVDLTLARADGRTLVHRYDSIPLSGSKTAPRAMESSEVRSLLLQHRDNVKEQGLREAMARQHPTATGASYVGSQSCSGCHPTTYGDWTESAHGKAWNTLVEAESGDRYGWPVTHYPDCVGCHVVGYREETGFVSPAKTPELKNVGCEQCHGPGSEHVKNPVANGFAKVEPQSCQSCHDYEQSPDFAWDRYWTPIAHGLEPAQKALREARKKNEGGGR